VNTTKQSVWFVTGSQHLYGEEALAKVQDDAKRVVKGLTDHAGLPVALEHKPTVTSAAEIHRLCLEANGDDSCIGLVLWMHTFSPAKMWLRGLTTLEKPFAHLHTQFGRDIPWADIDMDFMNLHQSAHGGREFGFAATRLGIERKVIVGHWQDSKVQESLAGWVRTALAWNDSQRLKVARFGDNMRDVAVTEGDKVEAQIQFGYEVHGYGIEDLMSRVREVSDSDIDSLVEEYRGTYTMGAGTENSERVREAARIEAGMRAFLEDGGFNAFTTNFENLAELKQLPGLAVQRLMADGYGFGAEGDWKTAALVQAMKVLTADQPGGVSFMEDYTYHLDPAGELVLGAHMLEVCPSIALAKPRLEVHPLGIGGKDDPARLVFTTASGPAVNVSIIDLGNRFRMIVSCVEVVEPPHELPKLPVASAVWRPLPDLKTAAAAWIYAGGAHHTAFVQIGRAHV